MDTSFYLHIVAQLFQMLIFSCWRKKSTARAVLYINAVNRF